MDEHIIQENKEVFNDNKKLARSLIKNTFWNFVFSTTNKVMALVLTIILARFLMPELFGIYSLAMSVGVVFLAFMNLGINEAVARYVSYELRKNKKKAVAYFNYLLKKKLVLIVVGSILLAVLAYPLSFWIFHQEALFVPLLAVSLYILMYSFDPFVSQIFYIFRQVKVLAIKEFFYQLLKLIFVLIIFLVMSSTEKVAFVFAFYALSYFIIFIPLVYVTIRKFGFLFKRQKEKIDKKRVFKYRTYLTIGAFSSIIFGYIDIIMIGILISDASFIGYYRSAFSLVNSLVVILTITNVLFPIFAQSNESQLKKIFSVVFKYSFIITIPIAFGIILLSNYIIMLFFGSAYLPASGVLAIMSLLAVLGVNSAILSTIFTAREKPEFFIKILIISSIVNIILNFALIKLLLSISFVWAIIGAAIATILSRSLFFTGLWVKARKVFELRGERGSLIKPLFAGIVMALVLWGFNSYFVEDMNIIYGLIDILIGVVVYFTVLILVKGLTKTDIRLIREQIRKFRLKFSI